MNSKSVFILTIHWLICVCSNIKLNCQNETGLTFKHCTSQLAGTSSLPVRWIINHVFTNWLHCNELPTWWALDVLLTVIGECYQIVRVFRWIHTNGRFIWNSNACTCNTFWMAVHYSLSLLFNILIVEWENENYSPN